jgi:hypothetical protein
MCCSDAGAQRAVKVADRLERLAHGKFQRERDVVGFGTIHDLRRQEIEKHPARSARRRGLARHQVPDCSPLTASPSRAPPPQM